MVAPTRHPRHRRRTTSMIILTPIHTNRRTQRRRRRHRPPSHRHLPNTTTRRNRRRHPSRRRQDVVAKRTLTQTILRLPDLLGPKRMFTRIRHTFRRRQQTTILPIRMINRFQGRRTSGRRRRRGHRGARGHTTRISHFGRPTTTSRRHRRGRPGRHIGQPRAYGYPGIRPCQIANRQHVRRAGRPFIRGRTRRLAHKPWPRYRRHWERSVTRGRPTRIPPYLRRAQVIRGVPPVTRRHTPG